MIESLLAAVRETSEAVEPVNDEDKTTNQENTMNFNEVSETQEIRKPLEDINVYNPEIVRPTDMEELKSDNIELQKDIEKFDDPEFINEVRNNNENMDKVMTKAEETLRNNPSEIERQKTEKALERYKGTVFENELKEALGDKFNSMEEKQKIIETDYGATKPDIILKDAKKDMKISDLEVKKGEDLYVEAKAGSAEYIQSEMPHILKQVEGHEGNSLVVVTNDYEKISPEYRAQFEQDLKAKGSHIYVADLSANQLDFGIKDSLKI